MIAEILFLKKTMHQSNRKMAEERTRLTEQLLEMTTKYNEEKERMDHAERVGLKQKHWSSFRLTCSTGHGDEVDAET
jgi:thymidine phosphorylase